MLPPIDLHCHSTASDGGLSPTELVALACSKGLRYLALTDHDTCDGLAEAQAAAEQHGLALINGIELSTIWNGCGIHVVGLGIDPEHPAMQQAVQAQVEARAKRSAQIDFELAQRKMPGVMARAREYVSSDTLGRPHFARAMVALGYVKTEVEAFDRFLGSGKPGDIRCHWPALEQVIGWINASGGIAVLAHPLKYDLNWAKTRVLLQEFKALGGGAMEVSYGGENPNRVIDLVRFARHYGLKMSVGSDFHRTEFHWTGLGKYPPLKGEFDPVWSELGIEL
jgi:predicted metal-dependent phosphoesterase TrpH